MSMEIISTSGSDGFDLMLLTWAQKVWATFNGTEITIHVSCKEGKEATHC